MYCVGLTGSIGAGKSTVAQLFANLGIDIISADQMARQLTNQDSPALSLIVAHFGIKVLNQDKTLNRARLRELIFNNPEERQWLDQLLHPLIRQAIVEHLQLSQSAYTLIEIPLLKTKSDYPYLNRVLWVSAPEEVQLQRIISRDLCTREQAQTILRSQNEAIRYANIADDIIDNTGDLEALKRRVIQLHKRYLSETAF